MTDFAVNPSLPKETLAPRETLPLKPDPVTLTGRYVRLEPLDIDRDAEPLFKVSNGQPVSIGSRSIDAYDAEKLIWRYLFYGPFSNLDDFRVYLRGQMSPVNTLCFCVFDLTAGHQTGFYTYMNNAPEHLKIEVGGIWHSPLVQRTNANTEATYLTLCHAFNLGYRRLEWKCDAMNERSRRAALRMGFKFEGIQDAHYIIKNRNRDTAWYRILDSEWRGVKAHLETLLYPS